MKRGAQHGVVLAVLMLAVACRENPPTKVEHSSATNSLPSPSQLSILQLPPGVTNSHPLFNTNVPSLFNMKDSPDRDRRLAQILAENFMATQPDAKSYQTDGIGSPGILYGGGGDYYDFRFESVATGSPPAVVWVDIREARHYWNHLSSDLEDGRRSSSWNGLATEYLADPLKPKPVCQRWH